MSIPLLQGLSLAPDFSSARNLTRNVHDVQGVHVDIPINPQWIYDACVPFNSLVLKPQVAAFDTELKTLMFLDTEGNFVIVLFTRIDLSNVILPELNGPGMWVIAGDENTYAPPIRATDGTDILIPEVHLAELTGIFGDLRIDEEASIPSDSEIWSECVPFARITYSTDFSRMLALPQNIYDSLEQQLTDELPIGAPVAIVE